MSWAGVTRFSPVVLLCAFAANSVARSVTYPPTPRPQLLCHIQQGPGVCVYWMHICAYTILLDAHLRIHMGVIYIVLD